MKKKFCRKCGNALTKEGARFCTICGATMDGVETDNVIAQETTLLPGEKTGQTVSTDVPATEALPGPTTPTNFETEVMPQVKITARAEKSATAVVAEAPVTQSQKKRGKAAPANRLLGGRKKLAVAASLGVVALAAVIFFIFNLRRPSETQGANLPADKTESSASAQPPAQQSNQQSNQQSGADANNQAQPQIVPATGEIKSPAVHNAGAASSPQPQRQAVAKPTPTTSQETQTAGGTTSAENNLNQGMTYFSAGRYQEALREFEQVKKLDPGNKNVYYLIGQAYQRMNQLQQALEAYRQCTSGYYASVAQSNAKMLEKKVEKIKEK